MVWPWTPISPLIVNMLMKEFEVRAVSSAPHPPHLWLRYVDDTFVIKQAEHCQQFLQYINSLGQHIKFSTTEDPKEEDPIPFLDVLVSSGPNNILTTMVYDKPTYTDQYLHLDSNHYFSAKHSVYNTLTHRVRIVCTCPHALQLEGDNTRQALLRCNFPQSP